MRILAIIPACEGSTAFPNKNMRVIHGKPLIYYAINNALASRYVTDIIVTSNSIEILSLGRQMGTMTRLRREDLCNISTSLDAVVWDVFEQLDLKNFDYIVTMQPISPTLKADTLDMAFEKMFTNANDTMISVRNQAQFFWKANGDKYIPIQKKRMNRNQLPPFYMETGAFLITRTSCIKKNTRIGKNVGLFELSGDESIDINNFGDLKLAENALIRKETAIFVNGNDKIGLGHITRMLQIADELFSKPDFYYDINMTNPTAFGKTAYNLIPIDGEEGFIEAIKDRHYDLILNDVLDTTKEFINMLRKTTSAKIINFEDNGSGAHYADRVFNALYEDGERDNIVTGSKYFIIPKLFLIYPPITIQDRIMNVVITFGGADPENYTKILLNLAMKEQYQQLHFFIILGIANNHFNIIDTNYDNSHITILKNINNMAEIMSKCDVAVSSRGRTCFELAALGIPTLSIAQHEREQLHTFVCEKNGFMCLNPNSKLYDIENAFDALVNMDKNERLNRQTKMLAHDLRNGRRNVVNKILTF